MSRNRNAALVRKFVCASVDKTHKLSATLPNSLKKISLLRDPATWFKVALKEILRQSKLPGAGRVMEGMASGGAQTFSLQPLPHSEKAADIQMTWEVSFTRGTVKCREDRSTVNLDLKGKGAQEVYEHIVTHFKVLPLIPTLLEAKSALESVTGLPFVIENETYSQNVNTASVEYKGGDANWRYLIKGTLSANKPPEWIMTLENMGVSTEYQESSLEALLEHVPDEGDSDLLWFSDKNRARQMIAKLEQILGTKPQKWDIPEPWETVDRAFAPLVLARGIDFPGFEDLIRFASARARYNQDDIWTVKAEGSIDSNIVTSPGGEEALKKMNTGKVVLTPAQWERGRHTVSFETKTYSLEEGFEEVSDFFKGLKAVVLA